MNKHTPGPWASFDNDGLIHIRTADNDAGSSMYNSWGFADIATCHGTDDPEQFANAKLIAAAPEMLGALDAILVALRKYLLSGDGEVLDSAVTTAIVAVEKATGDRP